MDPTSVFQRSHQMKATRERFHHAPQEVDHSEAHPGDHGSQVQKLSSPLVPAILALRKKEISLSPDAQSKSAMLLAAKNEFCSRFGKPP